MVGQYGADPSSGDTDRSIRSVAMTARRLRARYDGTCAVCRAAVPAGSSAFWDKDVRRLTCEACGTAQPEQTTPAPGGQPTEFSEIAGHGKRLRLRRDGPCSGCGSVLAAGTFAWWDAAARALICETCHDALEPVLSAPHDGEAEGSVEVEPRSAPTSTAGGSAQAIYNRRSARREERIRQGHPILGGVILALSDEPQPTTAWARGATGERRVGAMLDSLAGDDVVVLHDRRIPGGQANIDHLAVTPSGVWVIDAKRYRGQVSKKDVGGWFSTDWRLFVGRRDCTKLVAGMSRQVDATRTALGSEATAVPIRPLLCFVDAEWSWFAKPFTIEGVTVAWPKAAATLVRQAGEFTRGQITQIAERLAQRLPPAS